MAISISGLSGTLNHGNSLVISGTDFGSFGTNQIYDSLSDGTVSTTATIGTWETINSIQQSHVSNSSPRGADQYYIHFPYSTGGTCGWGGGTQGHYNWYTSYWFKLASDWEWGTGADSFLGNVKFWRLWCKDS